MRGIGIRQLSMTKKNKKKNKNKKNRFGRPTQTATPVTVKLVVEDTLREIHACSDSGEHREALRLAKLLFTQEADAVSEEALVETYAARIIQLLSACLAKEAGALLDVALAKHPDYRAHLTEASFAVCVVRGDWATLLSDYDERSRDERIAIDAALRRWLVNPIALTECDVLPADHPLRIASRVVASAFARVTGEVVPNSELQLREVSRRSPFAPWVSLIRAIAAFYRQEDDLAVELASRVPRDSAPFSIAEALACMIRDRQPEVRSEGADSLRRKVLARRAGIASLMEEIDRHLEKGRPRPALKAVRKLLNEARRAMPDIVKPLMQQISVRCFFKHLPADDVVRAMGKASIKDAAYWRLFAAAYDLDIRRSGNPETILEGCCAWNEFLYHAEAEGLLKGDSIAAAAVYYRMAKHIAQLPEFGLEEYREIVSDHLGSDRVNFYRTYAETQPEEIARRLRRDRAGEFLLQPEALFDRATRLHPNTGMFAEWYRWTHATAPDIRDDEEMLETWLQRCPDDVTPIIHLGAIYLDRGSFKKAERVLQKGRTLDSMNASINRLYRRALLIGARRHIKQAKPHLVEKDIVALTSLLTNADASGRAYLSILRALSSFSVGSIDDATAHFQEAGALLDDPLAAGGVTQLMAEQCGINGKKLSAIFPKSPRRKAGHALYMKSLARIVPMCERMALPVGIPDGWTPRLKSEAEGDLSSVGREVLTAVADAARKAEESGLLYAVSAAGLRLGAAGYAEFLWYRGHSLPCACYGHAAVLFHAAACRARRQGNNPLADKAMEDAVNALEDGSGFELGKAEHGKLKIDVPDDKIETFVSLELEVKRCPSSIYNDPMELKYRSVWISAEQCDCPECRAARGEDPFSWDFDSDDDDEWDFDSDDDDEWMFDEDDDDELYEKISPFDGMSIEDVARSIVEMTGLKPNATARELNRAAERFIEIVGEPPPEVNRADIPKILKVMAMSQGMKMPFLLNPTGASRRSGRRR